MSDVSITYAGIFHVKDDLWRFINTMEDHQKVLVFTINGENNIKSIFRIETSGIQKLLMQIGIPANLLGFSYIVTALELIALNPEYLNNITKGLYADVSEKCTSTHLRVERNIRHAIEIGLLKGNIDERSKFLLSELKYLKETNIDDIKYKIFKRVLKVLQPQNFKQPDFKIRDCKLNID